MNTLRVSDEWYESAPSDLLDYGPSFKGKPMWEQLGKIEDSQTLEGVIKSKKLKKVSIVETDDGAKFKLNAKQATTMKEIITAFPMPHRRDIFKGIQYKKGLTSLVKYSKIDSISDEVLINIWNEINDE